MIDFDVETTSLQHHGAEPCEVFLAQFGDDKVIEPELFYRDGRQPELDGEADDKIRQWLLPRFTEGFRAWNSKFDLHCLRQAGFELPPEHLWHDGMVAAHIIDERTSAALQARADSLLGTEEAGAANEIELKQWLEGERKRRKKAAKDDGEEYVAPNYSDVPREIMDRYAGGDILNTRKVSAQYYPLIESNPHFKKLYELEMRVMRALFWMEDRGIPMERKSLVALEAELTPRLEALEDAAVEESGFEGLNVRSPKQIGESLERLGANVKLMDRSKKTKQLVTDEENLLAVNHPFADAILEFRGTEGIFKWLRGVLHGPTGADADRFPGAYLTAEDKVHPNFRQMGARHGRMSCANPNFQNIPRDDLRLRYAVKAPPGYKLIACDLDAIELRVLAALAGPGPLMDVFNEGGDPHELTARRVGLTGRKRTTGDTESPRQQGKRMNYLSIFGGGQNAIKKWFGVDQDRARAIQQAMRKAYPEISQLQDQIEWKLQDRGYLESPLTKRRYRMYGSGYAAVQREGYRFINYVVSGTAADIIKIGTARCHEAGVPIIAIIHDEILACVPEADAAETAKTIERCMTTDFPLADDPKGRKLEEIVPILAEAQIIDRWSQAKDCEYIPDYVKESS